MKQAQYERKLIYKGFIYYILFVILLSLVVYYLFIYYIKVLLYYIFALLYKNYFRKSLRKYLNENAN